MRPDGPFRLNADGSAVERDPARPALTAHTVGRTSFPDFAGTDGEIPVNSYNRPYQARSRDFVEVERVFVVLPGSHVELVGNLGLQRADTEGFPAETDGDSVVERDVVALVGREFEFDVRNAVSFFGDTNR